MSFDDDRELIEPLTGESFDDMGIDDEYEGFDDDSEELYHGE
jgi:hypothetical protein